MKFITKNKLKKRMDNPDSFDFFSKYDSPLMTASEEDEFYKELEELSELEEMDDFCDDEEEKDMSVMSDKELAIMMSGFLENYSEYTRDGIDGPSQSSTAYYLKRDKYGIHRHIQPVMKKRENKRAVDSMKNSRSLLEGYEETMSSRGKHLGFNSVFLKKMYEKYGVNEDTIETKRSYFSGDVKEFTVNKLAKLASTVFSDFSNSVSMINEVNVGDSYNVIKQTTINLEKLAVSIFLLQSYKFNLKHKVQALYYVPYFEEKSLFNVEKNCEIVIQFMVEVFINVCEFLKDASTKSSKNQCIIALQSIKNKHFHYFSSVLNLKIDVSVMDENDEEFLGETAKYFNFNAVKVLREQEGSMNVSDIASQLKGIT